MSYETIRISELAKELGLTSKEVIEKLGKIGITGKIHSSTITADQVKRVKEFIADGGVKVAKKPKAFVIKKQKPVVEETKVVEKEPEKKEVVKKVTTPKPLIEKVERPKIERPKVEVVKPVSRIEIVRKGTRNQTNDNASTTQKSKTARTRTNTEKRPLNRDNKKTTQDLTKQNEQKREFTNKKPLQRRIISQDLYEAKPGVAPASGAKRKPDGKKKDKEFNKKEEQERISLEKAAAQHHKKKTQKTETQEEVKQIVVNKAMTVSELSEKINRTPAEIVKFLMMNGVMATVNQLIDVDTIKKVCAEYELEVLDEDLDAFIEEEMQKEEKAKALTEVDKKLLKKRAPVISIMGHVDHGKTTLLDSIRASKHKIVATEVGGITQSIGAYTVYVGDNNDKKIVFLDTPGHEAFTEMRARGAKATDIAILVVAADDGIMPQTIEAINHAKAADIPIIVAVNKIDKPGANPDKVLQQLTEHGLVPEDWGGDTIVCKVSALQGTGMDELLEYILLVADVQDLKANPKAEASGVVIEANLDKGKGPVATLLVQNGTLRTGNCIVVGTACGRIRALLSDSGERIQKAEPSTPVEILGLSEVPQAGEYFEVVKNEKEMKAIIADRKEKERDKRLEAMLPAHIRKEAVAGDGDIPQLNLIIKANTHGSAEAVAQAIAGVESKEITTKIIHVGVGDISEADVMLASASNALILGFTVKEDNNAMISAEREGVTIKKYDIIYQLLEDIEKTLLSLLEPEMKEVELGKAEVRQVFTIGKTNKIAGCYVTEGKIVRSKDAVLLRDGVEIFRGAIDQLKRFKDDVKEVAQGFECGISFSKFNDIQVGDIIEVSTQEEVERKSL